jgi:hypothetical protein
MLFSTNEVGRRASGWGRCSLRRQGGGVLLSLPRGETIQAEGLWEKRAAGG